MKFFHLADLHFGKQLFGQSLVENQRHWAEACLRLAEAEQPDAVVISGDIYDRAQPSAEAKALASDFLSGLRRRCPQVLMVAGNHDSGEMVDYLRELLSGLGIHAAGVLPARLTSVTLQDAWGPVTFWLMPYLFPASVAHAMGLEPGSFSGYTEAVRSLLAEQPLDFSGRNVLVAHQFVLSGGQEPERSASESSVGGVGQIDVRAFDGFDYVALGHIHKSQTVGRPGVRYAGTPLCYHFDEAGKTDEGNDTRGVLIVELGRKGSEPVLRQVPIAPLHPLRNIRGSLHQVLAEAFTSPREGEYLHVTLTDETVPAGVKDQLGSAFEARGSRVLTWDRDVPGRKTGAAGTLSGTADRPLDVLFADYYASQYPDLPMTAEEEELIRWAAENLEARDGQEFSMDSLAEELIRFARREGEK